MTKEKPFLLHIPACTWAQSTRQRSGCSINMGGLSSLCERQKRLQKSPRNFCNNSHETKPPNLPVAAAQGIDRQPQFCSADHVNLTARESCSSVNVWRGYLLQFQKCTFIFHTHTMIIQRTLPDLFSKLCRMYTALLHCVKPCWTDLLKAGTQAGVCWLSPERRSSGWCRRSGRTCWGLWAAPHLWSHCGSESAHSGTSYMLRSELAPVHATNNRLKSRPHGALWVLKWLCLTCTYITATPFLHHRDDMRELHL